MKLILQVGQTLPSFANYDTKNQELTKEGV